MNFWLRFPGKTVLKPKLPAEERSTSVSPAGFPGTAFLQQFPGELCANSSSPVKALWPPGAHPHQQHVASLKGTWLQGLSRLRTNRKQLLPLQPAQQTPNHSSRHNLMATSGRPPQLPRDNSLVLPESSCCIGSDFCGSTFSVCPPPAPPKRECECPEYWALP